MGTHAIVTGPKACELLAWMQMLAFTGPARSWEPKRLRIFAVVGRLVRGGRRLRLRLAARWPWIAQIIAAITRLYAPCIRLTSPTVPTTRRKPSGPVDPRPPSAIAGPPGAADA